jgi:hypothetical protein
MAHSLKLSVMAEGVETRPQLEYLRRNRCDEIQGFYFSRALPALELGQMVAAGAGLPPGHDPAAQPAQTLLIVDDDVNVLSSLHRLFRPRATRSSRPARRPKASRCWPCTACTSSSATSACPA